MDVKLSFAKIRGVSLTEKVTFTRNLALIVKAGMSLPEGLEILSRESSSPFFSLIIGQIKKDVIQGKEFSFALARYPRVFNAFYISMVKTGEVSGSLEGILKNLATHMEKERELRSKIIGALIYPGIIVSVMLLVIIGTMTFVVPRLTEVFQNFNATLPLSTRILIAASNAMSNHFLLFIGSTIGFILLIWYTFFQTQRGKIAFSWLILHLPPFNNITKKLNTARIARTMQTLVKSGVAILDALTITADVLQNHYYKTMILEARKQVEKGKQLNEILRAYPALYPPLATQLIAVGEQTGALELVLADLADFYEDAIDTITKNLSSVIEPVLMIIIGTLVGLLAISLLQPIYSLTSQISP